MKRIILNHRFFPPKISLILMTITCFLLSGIILGQEKSKKKDKPFDVKIGLATIYDDNILKYSEKYLDRFMNGEDEGRFQIETYDDVILKPSLQIGATYQIFKKQKSRINFSYNYSNYIVNDVKNWQFISLGFQQSFLKKASFRIAYSYVPEFYVRHFRDEDMVNYYKEVYGFGYVPETFVPFSFSKDDYGFWIQNTFFKDTRVRILFNYSKYFHNEHYTEYDCDNFTYGFLIVQGVGKKVDVELGFDFMTSDAAGNDGPQEPNLDADADNEGDTYMLGVSWQLPKIFKRNHSLSAGFEYLIRYYTTNNYIKEDPEHAGRVDKIKNLDFNYQLKLSKAFEVGLFYKWFGRDSGSPSWNDEYLSDEKDYRQGQVGLEVTYGLKF
jgi:hypothetical protein